MLYIAVVMVELSSALPLNERPSRRVFLAAGGIPAPRASKGPWSIEQREAVQRGIEWYLKQEQEPLPASLCRVFNSDDNWIAPFGFDREWEVEQERAERLHHCLAKATRGLGLTVTLFESI